MYATMENSSGYRGSIELPVATRTVSKKRLGRKRGSLSARDAATRRRLVVEMYGDS